MFGLIVMGIQITLVVMMLIHLIKDHPVFKKWWVMYMKVVAFMDIDKSQYECCIKCGEPVRDIGMTILTSPSEEIKRLIREVLAEMNKEPGKQEANAFDNNGNPIKTELK